MIEILTRLGYRLYESDFLDADYFFYYAKNTNLFITVSKETLNVEVIEKKLEDKIDILFKGKIVNKEELLTILNILNRC